MSMSLAGVLNPGVASPGNGVLSDDVGSFDPTLLAIIESGRGVYLEGREVTHFGSDRGVATVATGHPITNIVLNRVASRSHRSHNHVIRQRDVSTIHTGHT